ncbi:SpoIIE family protein phosphatase [Isoptericola jiangsuensis]|uniref:SpoIIE family protein phosphatase n=1 Tax=Isoptericola jiangsuensis TaxID=548579 RepID=UPI003AABFC0E
MAESAFLAPGDAVDLDNCAREPIHIPGLVQPRGVLLALRTDDAVVTQCSDNVAAVLGHDVAAVLGAPLARTLGDGPARIVLDHVADVDDPRLRNPLDLEILVDGAPRRFEAVLHHAPESTVPGRPAVLVVELEPFSSGQGALTYATTFQPVRDALTELDRAGSLRELYDISVTRVRELTGFDRVMLYRFDADHNGEVVAEAMRADLNSFLGLHYPASDIPPQARALYEKNWIRLISDIDYTPVPIVPTDDPVTGHPLDLTYGTLRSVSPIHVEYLQNMGVGASMSISLLREGRLWGLIACHHYSGAHAPSYAARAAAEFLGSTLSARLVTQAEDDRSAAARRSADVLAHLVAATRDDDVTLTSALTGSPGLLDLVPADGAFVVAEGRVATLGDAPDEAVCTRLATALAEHSDELLVTHRLGQEFGDLAEIVPDVAGVLALVVPGGGVVVWLRGEIEKTVDWGGDPYNKAIARREGDTVRLSPRQSFARWREVVRGTGEPWTSDEVDVASSLRGYLGEGLLLRGRRDIRAATTLQRSLLPTTLPEVDGWRVEALYEPSGGGLAGGDWYDALVLDDGRIAVAVGDVSGHGLAAAATMGQLRNALRALLVAGSTPVEAICQIDRLMRTTLPGQVATLVLVLVSPGTGDLEYVKAGHLPPVVVGPDGATVVETLGEPPLGVGKRQGRSGRAHVAPGGAVVLYSDGLVERRDESILDGVERLRAAATGGVDPADLVTRVRDGASDDDATVVVVRRA